MSYLWHNGTLIDKLAAQVSPFDHGFLYGDGVWEHLRVFGGKPFDLSQHLDLLYQASLTLGIDIPLSREELAAAVRDTVEANDRTAGYVRVIVSRGPGTLGPDPRKCEPQVLIVAEEYQPFPAELYGYGLHAAVYPVPVDTEAPENQVRSLGRPHVARAKRHALGRGCLEAVLTNRAGHLVGTTEGTLFVCAGGRIVASQDLPPDLVRWHAVPPESLGSPQPLTLADLLAAEEAFVTGTACGVIGVVRVDGRDIGTGAEGPITKAARERYQAVTRGE